MAHKSLTRVMVAMTTLVVMAAAVDYRNARRESAILVESPGEDSFLSESSSRESWDTEHLFDRIWNVQWGRVKPWWEGPNVCETENVDEKNHTEAGMEDMMRHFSSSIHTCEESESAYKCTTTQYDMDGYRKIVIVYECCKGYEREKGDAGCPRRVTLRDVAGLARDLGLTDFLRVVRSAGLERELNSREITVFAPVDGGFGGHPDLDVEFPSVELIQRDMPYTYSILESDDARRREVDEIQSGLLGHVISGARRSSSFSDEEVIETGGADASSIRINYFYAPGKNTMTANCVPVVSRDHRASNGVIHTVQEFLPQVTDSLLDIVKSRSDLTTLKTILALARYVPKLDADGKGTLLAPTNYAFDNMNPRLKERLLAGDRKCLQKVLDNHILSHTICSEVVQGSAHTANLLGRYLNITRTSDDKIFVHGAQVTLKDIMATNGVMHVIDKVIVPQEALDYVDVLEQEGFTELLNLVDQAGLTKTLETTDNVTIFAPTNEAIKNLPREMRTQLARDPELLKRVLLYHISPGAEGRQHYKDNHLLPTLAEGAGSMIRTMSYSLHPFHHYGVTTGQCVPFKPTTINACNGRIKPIEDVMLPPQGNVVDLLSRESKFSTLVSLVKRAGLAESLHEPGPYTILAPNNQAFERLGQAGLEELEKDVEKLKKILKRHVLPETLCCAGIFRGHNWFGHSRIKALSGERLRLSRDYTNTPTVHKSRVLTCDLTAINGNVLEIDTVIQRRSRSAYRPRWRQHHSRWSPYGRDL